MNKKITLLTLLCWFLLSYTPVSHAKSICGGSDPVVFTHNALKNGQVKISICSNKNGYLSLWKISQSQKISNIEWTEKNSSNSLFHSIIKGEKYEHTLVNSSEEPLISVWTETNKEQPNMTYKPQSPEGQRFLLNWLSNNEDNNRVTSTVTLNTTDYLSLTTNRSNAGQQASGKRVGSLKAKGHTGKVFLLAMGAKTKELKFPPRDAANFHDSISKIFNIPKARRKLYPKTTVQAFRNGMKWLSNQAKASDTVIIYFSGHGTELRRKEGTGRDEAFVLVDGELIDDEFNNLFRRLKTRNTMVFIDACFAAGLTKSLSSDKNAVLKYVNSGYKPVSTGKDLVYASSEGFKAWEDSRYGGVMTRTILTALQNPSNAGKNFHDIIKKALGKHELLKKAEAGIANISGGDNLLKKIKLVK